MWVRPRTAVNGDQRRLGSWNSMQETKPGRTREWTSERMPWLPWMHAVRFWVWQLAVWSSWASNVDKIVLGLSWGWQRLQVFVNLFFFVGVQKLWEGWSLQSTLSLELFRSFKICVTSHKATIINSIVSQTITHVNFHPHVSFLIMVMWQLLPQGCTFSFLARASCRLFDIILCCDLAVPFSL